MTEHVLACDAATEVQRTYYWCGPTATHNVLTAHGIYIEPAVLATQMGTTEDGTSDVSRITPVLNSYLPQADYVDAHIPDDPPNDDQRAALWSAITNSVDAGYGCVLNIVAPPSNYPRGVKGSPNPAYGGGTVFHYISALGYDDDPALRAVRIVDSGFRPFEYWIAFDQLATLIPPKGYAFSTAQPAPPNILEDLMTQPTNQDKLDAIYDKLTAYPGVPEIAGKWPSRARYAPNPTAGIDDTVGMVLWTDANLYDLFIEFAASQGFEAAKQQIAARAKADPGDDRAVFFAKKYPA